MRAVALAQELVRDVEREAARQQALARRFLGLVGRVIDGLGVVRDADGAARPDAGPAAGAGQPHDGEEDAAGPGTASRSPADAAGCLALGSALSDAMASSARNDIGALRALLPRLVAEEANAAAAGGCDPELLRVVVAQRAAA